MEDPWYSERRERWRPETINLLLIAESAPAIRPGDRRRYFYDEDLTGSDGLFREVVKVLLGTGSLRSGNGAKVPWLRQLRNMGVYLIDLSPVAVDKDMVTDRRGTLQRYVPDCVERASSLKPEGVVLIKRNVFELLRDPMRDAGLQLLHDAPIPFPGSGQQARFRERFSSATAGLRP